MQSDVMTLSDRKSWGSGGGVFFVVVFSFFSGDRCALRRSTMEIQASHTPLNGIW